jgi:hypothetical protein
MDDYQFISSKKYGKIEKEEALNYTKKNQFQLRYAILHFFHFNGSLLLNKSNLHTQTLKVRSSFALQRSIDLLWKCEIREVFE